MEKHYTLLDHTADLRIRVTGMDIRDLFKNAALALFDLIAEPQALESRSETVISVSGADQADLMVNFLREMLYLWTGDEQLVQAVDILQISDTAVHARVSTDRYQPDRHRIRNEIKAVTYHQVDVRRTGQVWQTTLVFDV